MKPKTLSKIFITSAFLLSAGLAIHASAERGAAELGKYSERPYLSASEFSAGKHLTGFDNETRYCAIGEARASANRVSPFSSNDEVVIPQDVDFQFLPQFGGVSIRDDSIKVSGLSSLPDPIPVPAGIEDDGSIPLATEISIAVGEAITVTGEIGDGEFGSSGTNSGDFDFFKLSGLEAGQTLSFAAQSVDPESDDFSINVVDSNGEYTEGVAQFFGEDIFGLRNSVYFYTIPEDGDYYIVIGDVFTFEVFQTDLFDSSSGTGNDEFSPPLTEGNYSFTIGLEYSEIKTVAFFATPGLALAAAATTENVGFLGLLDPQSTLRMGSFSSLAVRPVTDPLPDGLIETLHLTDDFGLYELEIFIPKAGEFSVDLFAGNPPLRNGDIDAAQTLFIDFDGEELDVSIFGGDSEMVFLEPLSDFLSSWDFAQSDEDALIDSIMAELELVIQTEIAANGGNRRFNIRLLNSRDHSDPWGEENVSRVIVGGFAANLPARLSRVVGVAQSIDTGNFDTTETALVLLDRISGINASFEDLNRFPVAEGQKINLVGKSIAYFVAHEAGHFLGNFHVEDSIDDRQIMDSFPFADTFLGDDELFGTEDDVRPSFGSAETFLIREGLRGIENTAGNIAYGATSRFGNISRD